MTTSSSNPTEALKRQIVEVHQEWRREFRKMFENPDPASPLLDRLLAEGPRKEIARARLSELRESGMTSPPRPGDVSAWSITEMKIESQTVVVVTECYLDGGWTLDAAGKVVDDKVYSYLGYLHFEKGSDGVWRVSEIETVSQDEGRVGCAEQLT